MPHDTCLVDGCERKRLARGLCSMHYARQRRLGEAGSADRLSHQSSTGLCEVDKCELPHLARGFCHMHYQRWQRHGDPLRVESSLRYAEDHHLWVGDLASYHTAHMRIRTRRGSATEYQCSDCPDRALDWSYNHDDPNEKHGPDPHGFVLAYSPDPNYYSPRCRPCHRKFDAKKGESNSHFI